MVTDTGNGDVAPPKCDVVWVGGLGLRATDVANILEVGCEVVASYEKDRVVVSVP